MTPVSEGQESGSDSAGWTWLRVSQEVTLLTAAGAETSSEGSTGLEGPLGSVTWLLLFITPFLVGVSGGRPSVPCPTWASPQGHSTWHLAFVRVRGPRHQHPRRRRVFLQPHLRGAPPHVCCMAPLEASARVQPAFK